MNGSSSLHDQRFSIVIPSARSFPQVLVADLCNQTANGDEILVIQNSPRSGSRHWVGVASGDEASHHKQHVFADHVYDPPILASRVNTIVLPSVEGAATARNVGWRSARNDKILFLDDDVTVDKTFLMRVRRHIVGHASAGVITFRMVETPDGPWEPLVNVTISLDRGHVLLCTGGKALRLHEVWQYGAGGAMFVDRRVLEATGGFKDRFGAGRKNGGTEDTEFLWHASRHTVVEYNGYISVQHKALLTLEDLTRKMREYGRAIGHLGGTARNRDGYNYMTGYCSHLKAAMSLAQIRNLPTSEFRQVRNAILATVVESAKVYAMSLAHFSQAEILCQNCWGAC